MRAWKPWNNFEQKIVQKSHREKHGDYLISEFIRLRAEGLTYKEIAEELGISLSALKQLRQRRMRGN